MREKYPFPSIDLHDYDAMRSLNGSNLPDTYDKWLKLAAKEKLEREQVGYDVLKIKINPHEFGRYCATRGVAADTIRMLSFASEKAAGNSY